MGCRMSPALALLLLAPLVAGAMPAAAEELKAKRLTGTLQVMTEPKGLEVQVDGKAAGPAPLEVEVPAGSAVVGVTYKNQKLEKKVKVPPGGRAEVEIDAEAELRQAGGGRDAGSGQTFTDPVTGMEFVWVPGGTFEMGDTFGDGLPSERPVHTVTVSGFWLGKTEVTQAQWEKVMGTTIRQQRDKAALNKGLVGEGPDYPMYYVSYDETREFAVRLGQKSGQIYRLPTEAEWEYAARSGGKKERWAGASSVAELQEVAWYADNSGGETHPVGRKKPNGLGLYDMTGNVGERCQDWYDKEYYGRSPDKDPPGSAWGSDRTSRGGWCVDMAENMRATSRNYGSPDYRARFVGFRLLRAGP